MNDSDEGGQGGGGGREELETGGGRRMEGELQFRSRQASVSTFDKRSGVSILKSIGDQSEVKSGDRGEGCRRKVR